MILKTEQVSKSFGRLDALVAVDVAVEEGEIFGIAGPNGAGKSTLFNVIAGTFPPTSGRIFLEDRDITRLNAHRICHLGIARTFQIPQTFQTLSVYDNIRVGATFGHRGGDRIEQRILASAEFLEIAGHLRQPASNLDLYTTKLVMMAASLATGCRLLMLDEPLAGLAITEINRFLEVVRKINAEQGITVLMIEHILESLIEVSDRLLILHNGEVLCSGEPNAVCRDPKVVQVYLGEGEDEA